MRLHLQVDQETMDTIDAAAQEVGESVRDFVLKAAIMRSLDQLVPGSLMPRQRKQLRQRLIAAVVQVLGEDSG